MERQFSTDMVAELTGASVRQIGYWAQTKLVRPSGQDAAGKGTRRRFVFRDIVAIITICKLRERECPLQKIRKAVRYLKSHYPDESDSEMLSRLTLLTDGDQVFLLTNEHEIMEVVSRQLVWAVPLGMLIMDARNRIDELPAEWTQRVTVRGRRFHLLISRDDEYGCYVAQCRELPGALEQGETPAEVIANGKEAVESVLDFLAKRERRSKGSKHAKAG
jgi:predicted RNase H-like HicB family nuclease